jgi:hypothetical protein
LEVERVECVIGMSSMHACCWRDREGRNATSHDIIMKDRKEGHGSKMDMSYDKYE